MDSKKLTLRFLKNTDVKGLYEKLLTKDNLSNEELETLLSVAIYLINNENANIRHLGYRIIVDYCNQFKNYNPLYEITINNGLYPISKFINDNLINSKDKNFFTEWNDCFTEQYRDPIDKKVRTSQQKLMNSKFDQENEKSLAVVAPTSYGKSELIIKLISENMKDNICVVTSTKALLAQTRKRIKDANVLKGRRIITSSEMLTTDLDSFVAVVTQERLYQMLKNRKNLSFKYLIIDEAHELLNDNSRSHILARDIIILTHRNKKCVLKFLTPFMIDPQNLKVKYVTYNLDQITINEYLKSEKYFVHDIRKKTNYLYDQFFNQLFELKGNFEKPIETIINNSDDKNIIYLNKPQDVEDVALKLSKKLPYLDSKEISSACTNLAKYVHPDYKMIDCLKKGVIYHHGSVSDSVRLYMEKIYKEIPEIKYIVTSSTLLSGVNLPATRLFLLDVKKGKSNLRFESFKNLVGRVCRFDQIFNEKNDSLNLLEPEIHIIIGPYTPKKLNLKRFLNSVAWVEKKRSDNVNNILLDTSIIKEKQQKDLNKENEYIENFQAGIIPNYNSAVVGTEIGHACIMNNITDFNIFDAEERMQQKLVSVKKQLGQINNVNDLMDIIQYLFIAEVPDNNPLNRLNETTTLNFYKMMMDWKQKNLSYSQMISSVVNYWHDLYRKNENVTIYAGKWGNKEEGYYKKWYTFKGTHWIDIINLAIVRVKEEEDFIANSLMKYVEVLKDLDVLDNDFYLMVKYGTTDANLICILKNGFSLDLADLLTRKYKNYLIINTNTNELIINPEIIDKMEEQHENTIQISEVRNYL